MNNLDTLYQELGSDICLCPFLGAFYQTNNVIPNTVPDMPNSVRPCSIVMSDNQHKWDITNNNVTDARNTDTWKNMRKEFIQGNFHKISDCRVCSHNEQVGATSPRQQNNQFLGNFLTIDIVDHIKTIIANDYIVNDIVTLDYYPSNYCNYSCIMCAGGASSKRQIFEVTVLNQKTKIVLNSADPDFFNILKKVQIINFTGGETVLQPQVHDIIDYLIERGLSKNIMITLLTNASSSPQELDKKFKQFKKVIYNVSIDGIGDVIEYQRRGCNWKTVEKHSLELMHHPYISTVINYVLTAVNVLSAMDFVNWAYDNNFGPKNSGANGGSFINISPVFRVDHLGQGVLPPALRELALNRLYAGKQRFDNQTGFMENYYSGLVDKIIGVINSTAYQPEFIPLFVNHIRKEDLVSKKHLIDVVPEWAPWFS